MAWRERPVVVLDNGTGTLKAGLSRTHMELERDFPDQIVQAVVGRPNFQNSIEFSTSGVREGSEIVWFGQEALDRRGILHLSFPLEHGVVSDWDDMSLLWQYLWGRLGVCPEEHAVLLTDAPMNPKENREKMAQVLFEGVGVPAFHVSLQAVLALHASGSTTGCVVDCGDGVTHTIPVYEGYALQHAIQRLDLAGRDLTYYMKRLLVEKGIDDSIFSTSAGTDLARVIKETQCFVAFDYDTEEKQAQLRERKKSNKYPDHKTLEQVDQEQITGEPRIFQLPDGQLLLLDRERFQCPEALFRPSLLGKMETPGISHLCFDTIMNCHIDTRRELLSNIVLSGGTTLTAGFVERFQKEIIMCCPQAAREWVQVNAPLYRRFLVWLGGNIMANLCSFMPLCVTATEYEENGPSIVHQKCFS